MTPEQHEAFVAKVLGVPKKQPRKTGRRFSHTLAFANGMLVAYTVNAFADDVEGWRLALLVFMAIVSGVGEVYAIHREDCES
jgi:hypothetical protein